MRTPLKLLFIFVLAAGSFTGFTQDLQLQVKVRQQDTLQDLYKQMQRFKEFSSLEQFLHTTQDSLQKAGFLDTNLESLDQLNDSLYIGTFYLGIKTTEVKLNYQDSILGAYAKKTGLNTSNKGYFLTTTADFERIMADFTAMEAAAGYPLSAINLQNIVKKGDTLYASLLLNREKERKIDGIKIEGYAKFPESFLKRYAGLKKGLRFDRKKIDQKAQLLAELPFVNQLKDPEVLFEQDSTTVFLYLEKNTANRFDGFLGFGNSEDSGRLRLDGYLDLHLQNNLNYGELLELNYKSDGNDQQTLRVAAEMPYLFQSPLGTQAELNLFRRDTTFSTSRQELSLFYQLQGTTRFSGGIVLENSTALLDSLNVLGTANEDYKKIGYHIGFSRKSNSKEKLFPLKNSIAIKTSYGKRESQGTTENQFAIEGEAFHTFTLSQKQQFYIANTTKDLISKRYFNNELFRFGGINSIRGFKENAINANLYSVFRTEYRYLAAPGLYIHSVADAAYFENEIVQEQGLLYSFGIGSGILTGAGLLNINLANGLQEGERFKFSNSILHIRLITFF